MKTKLSAMIGAAIALAPMASADTQDQPFLSFLASHKVVVDRNTAIHAAHIACTQIASGLATSLIEDSLLKQFPTTINGAEYWIVAGARQTYCPH